MHELSLVHALFDEADRAIGSHHGGDVQAMTVRIGELAGVELELFRTAFVSARAERGYGASTLDIVFEPAVWACGACDTVVGRGEVLGCTCGGEVSLRSGGALFLDRLELEVDPDVR